MKLKHLLVIFLGLGLTLYCQAQNRFEITFQGACETTDTNGHIVTKAVNNKTLIEEAAAKSGAPNTKSLVLVYHRDGNENGDHIEVVNKKTGESVYTNYGILFPNAPITNTNESHRARLFYVFTDQSSHGVGSAIVNEHTLINKKGIVKRSLLEGEMQYHQRNLSNEQCICTGNFVGTKPLKER